MKYPIRYRIYLPITATVALAACILRTVACLTARTVHGHFPGSALPEISAWLLVFGALIALTYPLFQKEPSVRPLLFSHPVGIFPTGMLALCEALLCTELIPLWLASRTAFGTPMSPIARVILLLTVLFGLLGIGYYILCLAIREPESELRAWFGMAAGLFFALYAVFLYFDSSLPLNATTKLTSQVTYLAMAVYLLLDVRLSLGRARYRLQVCFGLIAASVSAYAAIPSLLTYFIQGTVIDHTLYETLCTLAFFLLVCARLFAMTRLPENKALPFLTEETVTGDVPETQKSEQAPSPDAVLETQEETEEIPNTAGDEAVDGAWDEHTEEADA